LPVACSCSRAQRAGVIALVEGLIPDGVLTFDRDEREAWGQLEMPC
jgi:hypothetical protein